MTDHDTLFSSNDKGLSLSPNLDITIDEGSPNSEQLLEVEDEGNGLENGCDQLFEIDGCEHENGRDETIVVDSQSGDSQGKDYPPPIMGMEFDTYDDAYNYYNNYAGEIGFAIRVKSSWTKRNSKEKRGAVLCCNCEGFKTVKEANSHRKETRTGCRAMVRLRLVESNKWRVDEVKLEHNHSFDPERAQNSKSRKRMDSGAKRKIEPRLDVEVRTIKLYRMPIADASGYGSSNSNEAGTSTSINFSRCMKLKKGDAELISSYFCHRQLMNPNFFYVMDLNDDGQLRNIFWIDSRSRAAYNYFGDVVAFDSTYLSNNYEIPLVAFVGVNHHGQSVLLGCALLADETFETYIWLFRAWLTCMSGRPPQTILTNQCKTMQNAIAEVFPRAHHRICLLQVMQSILECLVQFKEYEAFQMALTKVIYEPNTVDEFERDWDELTQHFGIRNHEKLQNLHEEREHWAPVYSKDTFFAGISDYEKGESVVPFFKGHVHHQTSLKEFFETYELFQQKKYKTEVLDDLESHDSSPLLKTRCYYELQLSKLYTNAIYRKFQDEVVMMSSCFSISQIQANGSIVTFLVKERQGEEPVRYNRHFEVMYDKTVPEVRCMCNCFNFKGYLCRHALYVLNYNGVGEIPCQYILSRWRKDFNRLYVPHLSSDNVDITNPVQCFDHLYKRAIQVVEEGILSQNHYTVSWQAFKESLNKIRLVADRSPPNECPFVKNILLLDSDGKRVAAKYFSDDWPTNNAKESFEKTVFIKTQKTNAHTEAEIAMFENNIVVYKFVQDLHFFVTGGDDKNEIIFTTVLQAFFDSVGLLLRGNVEKKEALENLDLILLCIDKIVDGGGIILETDPNFIARKVASNSIDFGSPLFEQTPSQALTTAGQHLARSLLK